MVNVVIFQLNQDLNKAHLYNHLSLGHQAIEGERFFLFGSEFNNINFSLNIIIILYIAAMFCSEGFLSAALFTNYSMKCDY